MNGEVGSQQRSDPQQLELLRVCRIGRAQGLKGEVTIRTFTDEPERRFAPGSVLYSKDGSATYTVTHSRTFKDRWILHLQGVGSREAAEALNGTELYAEADDRDEMAEEDAWYPKDLIGLRARLVEQPTRGASEAMAGKAVGKVVDVIDSGAQSLLKIRLATPVIERKDGSYAPADDAASSAFGSATASDTGNKKDPKQGEGANVIKTALVPFVDELVPDIDLDGRYLTLDPPGGLIPGV
ncbi:ribosome maturation factor RimM [Bifidobacterium sp. ESL0790]|uniref:ribosome maturation factor RimM n=1 Tax=Bifidobacterium sp. ESL0790 TaxID=2983233 RepID=UPI0023F6AA8B|nr:ribosome maturation factor RimM [Bifidobacterium sp. ESL0790]WEV72646.1 ribosome maturation factor RimM [Bifidobacterium sp. ESL0790]